MMPSIGMIDPHSGKPHPQFHVMKLLRKELSSSRTWVQTSASYSTGPAVGVPTADITAQAFRTEQGRKLLLVNKRNRAIDVVIEGGRPMASIGTVDELGVTKSAHTEKGAAPAVVLRPFAVAMVAFE